VVVVAVEVVEVQGSPRCIARVHGLGEVEYALAQKMLRTQYWRTFFCSSQKSERRLLTSARLKPWAWQKQLLRHDCNSAPLATS